MNTLIKLFPLIPKNYYVTKWYQQYVEIKIIITKILRQFHRPPYPKSDSGEINLHLGCGTINHPEFINIDGMSFSHVHYVRAIDDLSPFKDESINLIYACHCLEHFSHHQVPTILSHWFIKLKPEGILRLSVPDFDKILNIYLENNRDVNMILGPLMGGQNDKFDFHSVTFTHENLNQLLINTGFKEVRKWYPHSNKLSDFDDWSDRQFYINGNYYPVSLNLEAVK